MSDPGSQPPANPPPSFPPPPPNMAPPPGYVAYGGPGAAMSGQFGKIGGISKALGILLMIYIPLQLVSIIGLFGLRDDARDLLAERITEDEFNKASQANVASLVGLLVIPIAVLTIIWMYRMAGNLRQLGRTGATWSPGWAIGGWFCPPCAIYAIPWLMFRELWRGSDPEVAAFDPDWKSRPVPGLVNLWWVLYGLVPLVGFATSASMFSNLSNFDSDEIAERIDDFFAINVVLALVGVGTAVVYLWLVRQLSARHMSATHET